MKIKTLKLLSKNYKEQVNFYSNILGFEIICFTDNEVKFKVGISTLIFVPDENSKPYHFAFNIPANKDIEALNWLKEKWEILKFEGKELQDFESWNAKAIYFYDPDGNIVEFIARKNLHNESSFNFNANSITELSEIGVPVSDIEPLYQALNKLVEFKIYDGSFDRFCALGDKNGLFICVNKDLKDWFPTGEKAYSSDFEIVFEQKGTLIAGEFKNEILQLANYQ